MKSDKARQLAGMLYSNNSPQTLAYVEHCLQEEGLKLADLYQMLEMSNVVEAFRLDNGRGISELPHSHRFCEIIYCQTNCSAEYIIGSKQHRLQRGDVVLIPPGTSHAAQFPDTVTEPFVGYTLWISTHCMELLRDAYPFFRPCPDTEGCILHTAGTLWEHVDTLFREAARECELKAHGWEAAIMGITTFLLTQLQRVALEAASAVPEEDKPELLEQILAYVEMFLSEKITLEDVAKRFWVSQSTVTHLFNNKMGISFYKYVTRRRLTEAKNLIFEDMPMEKIATRVGFTDYSTFYRAFKREFGISPQQFRKICISA